MQYKDLRDFVSQLEQQGALKRITQAVSPRLEVTEICRRCLAQDGPALLFENVGTAGFSLLANLFGRSDRIAQGMGCADLDEIRALGKALAELRNPSPPQGMSDAWKKLPMLQKWMQMRPQMVSRAPWQDCCYEGDQVNLQRLPLQTCWPEDISPLISWGLVITQGPLKKRQNIGIYRQQLLAPNRLIMRWLPQRGGARDWAEWQRHKPDQAMPLAVAIGADPATMLAAVCPIPDTLSEYAFASLLRNHRSSLLCNAQGLQLPASAEIVLEGFIHPNDCAPEGPFGDHTGYYNEIETFPVFTVTRMSHRKKALYHSTYTGRPPDEPAMLGLALNELFVPLLIQQFPEIVDFYLPPEGCSYRIAIVSIRKQYPGHASRLMFGIWSFLRQFLYTKWIIVVDEGIDIRQWSDVMWAISTRFDASRDLITVDNTPMDYLDFSSPQSGLGCKLGFDATNKWPSETKRQWGRPLEMDKATIKRVDELWETLAINPKDKS